MFQSPKDILMLFRQIIIFSIIVTLITSCNQKGNNILKNSSDIDKLSVLIGPPDTVFASDGVYDKYVLVYWNAVQNAEGYKVYRTEVNNVGSKKEITKNIQQETWLSDYSAKVDHKYNYEIQTLVGDQKSRLSSADLGFLKQADSYASYIENEESVLTWAGTKSQLFINIETTSLYVEDKIAVDYEIKGDIQKNSQVRFYLSSDSVLSWGDNFLSNIDINNFESTSNLEGSTTLILPATISSGSYFLLSVYSTDGSIEYIQVIDTAIDIK